MSEATLIELFETGRRAWPGVALEREVFLARVSSASASTEASVPAADLYLALACAFGDVRAISLFDKHYLTRVPAYLSRMGKSPSFADEVTQRLREKLLVAGERRRAIGDYAGRGSLHQWVRAAAVRQAVDLLREERHYLGTSESFEHEAMAVTASPELACIVDRYRPHFRAAFASALEGLTTEERNLLRFHLLEGLNIAQIGALFGKSRATIGRRLIECRSKILEKTREALSAALAIPEDEVGSIMRLLQSQLDVSVGALLSSHVPGAKGPLSPTNGALRG